MYYRFISYLPFNGRERVFDIDAFASESQEVVDLAVANEIKILIANGHSRFIVRDVCSARTMKENFITIKVVK